MGSEWSVEGSWRRAKRRSTPAATRGTRQHRQPDIHNYSDLPHMNALPALLLSALLSSTALCAQDDDKHNDKWNGLRAGYHLSNFKGDNGSTAERGGYYVGYYRNFIKVPVYSLSTGLEFNTAGSVSDESERRLSYLALPINNRFKFGPVYVDLGVDVALKVGEKALVNGTEVDLPSDAKAKTFDLLVHGGAGFKVLFLSVEARYRYGLTEVYEGTHNTGLELGLSTFF